MRDGERLASYPASVIGAQGVQVLGGEECRIAAAIVPTSFARASKAPVAAWWERLAGTEERWRAVRDGRPVDEHVCTRFWATHPPELSPDGRRVAYACAVGSDVFLIADGVRHGPYADVWGIAWSEDGRHFLYGASDGGPERAWAIYVDGVNRLPRRELVWRPRFGTVLAWQAQRERSELAMLGIERRPLVRFDDVLWGPTFTSRRRVAWVIRRGRRLTRIEVDARG
jgi:hypothetical protein